MGNVAKRRVRTVVPALALIALGAVGCTSATKSSSSAPPSPTATVTVTSTPICAAAAKLKTSVTDLRSVDVINGGLGAVQAAVGTIQTNLDEFQAAAKKQFGPQVTQMRTSLGNVRTALSAAQGNINVTTLAGIATSVTGLVTSYNALQNAVKSICG